MKIKLKGELDSELIGLGLKSGDIIEASPDPASKVGAMHFSRYRYEFPSHCTVWPENYDLIESESESQSQIK